MEESSIKYCQVCSRKAHGCHFGAVTCRACAAFFRRLAAGPVPNDSRKCRTLFGNCIFPADGKPWCKKCRMDKCKMVGMTIESFQFGRDLIGVSKKIPSSISVFLGRPQTLIHCNPQPNASSTFVDLTELMKKAKQILETENTIPFSPAQNRLRKLSYALHNNRSQNSKIKRINLVSLKESTKFWEYDVTLLSKWLAHFDEFQRLQNNVKLQFLKTIWNIWNRLEKLSRTAKFLKCQPEVSWNHSPLILQKDCILDLKNMDLDVEWLTAYSLQQIGYYIEGVGDWSMFASIQPLLDLDPTEIELNYMLAQISFSYAARELDSPYSEIAENFIKLLAEDLHNYYTKEMGTPRYSQRVIKIMNVNNSVMKVLWERKEKLEVARTFRIFQATFSEPEMFKDIF